MGLPPPVVTWKHRTNDGKERVMSRTMYRNQGKELYFKELTEADEGVYVCVATNELDDDSDEIVLSIGKWQGYGILMWEVGEGGKGLKAKTRIFT